jgi:hypothetical protein
MRRVLMRRFQPTRALLLLFGGAMLCGCASILGDFGIGEGPSDGGDGGIPPVTDSGNPDTGGNVEGGPGKDGGGDATLTDSGEMDGGGDATPDVLSTPDVGPPGNPGVAITAGGTYSKSAHYTVIGALGESPGGNTTAQSQNYKLQSGVIGATQ